MAQQKSEKKSCDLNERVIVILVHHNLDPLTIKVKLKTKWAKVIAAFGDSKGLDTNKLRFLFDGNKVGAGDYLTIADAVYEDPQDFEEADVDDNGFKKFTIHVMSEALGGANPSKPDFV